VLPLANGLSSDGYTFTASNIPVYQSGQYIYVYEYTDSTLSTELAGTYDYVIGTVGGSGQINLVMNMLVKYLAWTTYTNGYGAQIIDGTSSTDPQQCGNELLYFFPTDALGGFIAAPYGGIPNVVLESQSSENSGTSKLVRNPDGTYSPLWDSNYDSIDVTFSFDGTFFSNPTVQTTIQYNDYNCE
jgi:hypothetical protein